MGGRGLHASRWKWNLIPYFTSTDTQGKLSSLYCWWIAALLMVSTSIMMDVTSLLLGKGGSPNSSVDLLWYYPVGRQVEADIQVPYWHHGGGELLTGWWDENHGSLLCFLWYHPGRGTGVTALIWVHLWELPLPKVDNLTLGLCPFSSLCGGILVWPFVSIGYTSLQSYPSLSLWDWLRSLLRLHQLNVSLYQILLPSFPHRCWSRKLLQ